MSGEFSNLKIVCNERKSVDLDALNFLATGEQSAFCPCSYANEKKHHIFSYDTGDCFSLSQLQAGLSFENVVDIVVSALTALDTVAARGMTLDNVKIAKEYVFGAGGQFRFVYIPIEHKPRMSAKEFLIKLLSVVRCKDVRLVQAYKKMRKAKGDQEVLLLAREFVQAYAMDVSNAGKAPDLNSEEGTTLLGQEEGTTLLSAEEGTTLLSREEGTTLLSAEEGTTLLNQNELASASSVDEGTTLLNQDEGTTLLGGVGNTAPADGETTVLSLDGYGYGRIYTSEPISADLTAYYQNESAEYETTVLSQQPVQSPQQNNEICSVERMYLTRNSTGEQIAVDVTPFTIGKDGSNMDYVLYNDSISRHHATITYEDGNYYIMDNLSTNGTIIEGVRLQPGEKCEVGNGFILTLGSESFQTHIERRV